MVKTMTDPIKALNLIQAAIRRLTEAEDALIAGASEIRMDRKYRTRGNRQNPSQPVRILCVDGNWSDLPVVGFMGKEYFTRYWTINGGSSGGVSDAALDLIEVGENDD